MEGNPEPQLFRHPRSWRFGFGIKFPLFICFCLAMVVLPLAARTPFAAVLVPFGLSLLLVVCAALWLLPSRILVTEEFMSSTNYIGRSKQIRWRDTSSIQQGSVTSFSYENVVRITDGQRGGAIVITDAISNFPVLLDLVRTRAPAANNPMARRWRLLLGG